jgi:hypothetical protein
MITFEIVYRIGLSIMLPIWLALGLNSKAQPIAVSRKTAVERGLLGFGSVGTLVIPFLSLFTPWIVLQMTRFQHGWAGLVADC